MKLDGKLYKLLNHISTTCESENQLATSFQLLYTPVVGLPLTQRTYYANPDVT